MEERGRRGDSRMPTFNIVGWEEGECVSDSFIIGKGQVELTALAIP